MYFGLSEEQQFFQESITKYLEDIVTVDSLREYRKDYDNDLSKRVYNGLNELGICGLIIPDEYGGLGLDSLFAISISEALGKGVAPYPYIGSFLIAPYLINSIANDTQKKEYLSGIASGEYRFGVALSEITGRRNDIGIKFTEGKIDGKTLFVMDDIESTHYLVVDQNYGAYVIDAKNDGIKKVELKTVDITSFTTELVFSEVEANILGNSDNLKIINQALSLGRVALAANSLGASQSMIDKSIQYAKERKQFGRQIGSFQAVKHMCAQMASDLEPCYSMVWYAAHAIDYIPNESQMMACQTKAHLSEVSSSIAKTATEVHGGMGFTDDLGLHYWFKRIGLNRQLLGSPDLLREEAAEIQGL